MHIRADLHVHTRASDGDLDPEQVVSQARYSGIDAVAVTDHDTVAGTQEALDSAKKHGIEVIAGVEISAVFEPGTLHILGYFPSYPQGFEQALKPLQEARKLRFPRMVEKLNRLGIDISLEDVLRIAGNAQVGRPHIAKALINKGSVRDFDEAFSRYLAKGRPAYVEKEKMSPREAVRTILAHNGIPVLAHPFTLDLEKPEFRRFIRELADYGLMGIEISYPEHTRSQKRFFTQIAQEHGLLVTGGTDYHGPGQGGLTIGSCGLDAEALRVFRERLYQRPSS
ncbi:MAG: PHP domain-containing protein [Deltaproteobacteria bacterium]|nr:PHP domain-containing protein [Deltaproteobacteria bacterium]